MPRFGYHEEAAGDEGGGGGGGDLSPQEIVAGAVNDGWRWSEAVAGEGATPDWLKGDKYKTVEAQAKAYGDLESRFGSFTGAPDEYESNISDELKSAGFEIDAEDPVVQEFSKWAKESNLSQEGYNGLLNLKGMMDLAEQQAFKDQTAEEFKQLGPQAQARVDNLNAWASANMTTEMTEGFQELASSAKSVEVLEALIAKTRNAPISPSNLTPSVVMSSEELLTMQFAKDDSGNRKMSDPAYRARFQKLSQEVHGASPHRKVVG